MAVLAPHVMVLPTPAQGHVTPLMELSHRLVDHGFEVTFVCTGLTHTLLLDTMRRSTDGNNTLVEGIRLVSIPDGMADGDDRRDLCKLVKAMSQRVPGYVGDLIRETEASGATKVKWLVADINMGFCFQAARNLGVRVAGFWPAAASCLVTSFRIPEMIQHGFIDDKGIPKRQGSYEIAPKMPPLYASHLLWNFDGPSDEQQAIFQVVCDYAPCTRLADITVCNSFLVAETTAFELFPDILPIGPLFADQELRKRVGQFWPEDVSCLEWLDAQSDSSVVYVAFGSLTIFGSRQFRELAEGLELTGRPFLWVVRPDFTSDNVSKVWFDEFQSRIAGKGMIVSWCAQQQVLAHPAVACFLSHCGWNSTTEGVRNGVPILCWPYFVDQFANRSYICDIWMTGLAVTPDEEGIVTKEEVASKLELVIGDKGIAERVQTLRDAAHRSIDDGGSSYENFKRFVNLLME